MVNNVYGLASLFKFFIYTLQCAGVLYVSISCKKVNDILLFQ